MAMNSRLDAAAYRLQADAVVEKRRQSRYVTGAVYAVLLGMVIWSIDVTVIQDTDWERMGSLGQVLESVNRFIGFDFDVFSDLLVPTIETLLIACFGTFLGLILCIPAAWFGAMNITPYKPVTYPIARLMMTLSRSVHEIVWALIFVSAGRDWERLPGILAIAVRSVGFICQDDGGGDRGYRLRARSRPSARPADTPFQVIVLRHPAAGAAADCLGRCHLSSGTSISAARR